MFSNRNIVNKLCLPIILSILICYQNCQQQSMLAFGADNKVLIGKASWYSKNDPTDPWEHKTNADGSRFNENAFTCAMRSRDFGKYYKITNLDNGRSVIVKHRDYGPALTYKGRKLNRICDLNKAAFEKIADLDSGIIKVKIEERR